MRKIIFSSLLFLALFAFSSCSKIMGYSVLLWNLPENQLQDGDVVPVYIRSNISHVYVIGTSSGKVEVPLWQLTDPVSKGKVKKVKAKYAEFNHKYATVAMDGLPMRAEAVNTAKQVYRLRKNETVKLLYTLKGQSPMTGGKALPGQWMKVLTSDGTFGCCFSYNLRPFETDITGKRIGGEIKEEVENPNADFDAKLLLTWYPDSYKNMIDTGRVDVEKLIPTYNFHLDEESRKLTFRMPKIDRTWDYTGADETGPNVYKLKDIPIIVTVRYSGYIVVRYTGESGKPEDFNLVTIEGDLNEILTAEKNRRENEFEQIYMYGPSFKSGSYGSLTISEDHSFIWSNNRLLVSSGIISSASKNSGSVECKYFLSKSMQTSYDGVLTFHFEGQHKEANFLYKMEENGLRLEDANGTDIKNSTISERAISPLVMFFSKLNQE
ncbi:MAG: hypothetical protein K6F15_10720 [Treponema sp.]|nr:hypothetical protein [Treponema sp.]